VDIFEFGMKMELDGEAYYREIAGKSTDKGMKTILELLADSEVKHYNVLKKMKEHADPELGAVTMMPEVKNVFEEMKAGEGSLDADVSHVEMYQQAKEVEAKSEAFYREQAEAADTPEVKKFFTNLANEEKEHGVILGNICDMLGRPDTWLENAEWRHMDEY
jgi:rubrerythrin